jgi:hypothetical protein
MRGEIIYLKLYDVGRDIELDRFMLGVKPLVDKVKFTSKLTPSYLAMPLPVILDIAEYGQVENTPIKNTRIYAKLYHGGVITMEARCEVEGFTIEELHTIPMIKIPTPSGTFIIQDILENEYRRVHEQIDEYIIKEGYVLTPPETEKYTAYCIYDDVGDPANFVSQHEQYLASLLLGGKPNVKMHENQIKQTLSHHFSFLENEYAVFDWDFCLIFDQDQDYEDILKVAEIANFMLLELRVLDRLLDQKLDAAERDIRDIFLNRRNQLRTLTKKVGDLLKIRYDMLFILENLENVTKIIGDYYLGQIYKHLCHLFEVDQWSDSVRNRLDTLENIYNMAKTEANERVILYMEMGLAFIFVSEFITGIIPFILGFF